jgi:N-acetylglucosaminyldiphosphoundecaprenol N-acetyl-beta-D-mannosaminyltransferase
MSPSRRCVKQVLDANIDAISWRAAIERVLAWAKQSESRYVCFCNAHVVATARMDPEFARVINGADMAPPDGAPIAWMLRRLGIPEQRRIDGPGLMWSICAAAAEQRIPVFFFGSTPVVLEALRRSLSLALPDLRVAGCVSPAFAKLSDDDNAKIVAEIHASGAPIVFVGLGCPKQERWMAAHRGALRAVMLGVGAAFDFHAGVLSRAPLWMQRSGLEWLYRLLREPKRLAHRYLITNTVFIVGAIAQLAKSKCSSALS